jgi:hypothetical protein
MGKATYDLVIQAFLRAFVKGTGYNGPSNFIRESQIPFQGLHASSYFLSFSIMLISPF